MVLKKFSKEDVHAKFLSDDIDTAIFKRLDKVGLDLVCAVLADRLGEALGSTKDPERLKAHCLNIVNRKCDEKLDANKD